MFKLVRRFWCLLLVMLQWITSVRDLSRRVSRSSG